MFYRASLSIAFALFGAPIMGFCNDIDHAKFLCPSGKLELRIELPKAEAILRERDSVEAIRAFEASDFRVKRWKSGEWAVSFRFVGVGAWESEEHHARGRVSFVFDKAKDSYEAKFYFADKQSNELQLVPRFTWPCTGLASSAKE